MMEPDATKLFATDVERTVLGVMILGSGMLEHCATLQPEDFRTHCHRKIFVRMRTMHERGLEVDQLTLMEEMRRLGELEDAGGPVMISDLTQDVWARMNIDGYIAILKEKSRLRDIVNVCESARARAFEGDESTAILHDMQASAASQQSQNIELKPTPIAELVVPFLEAVRSQRESSEPLRGVTTGLSELDDITSGWCDGELTYVGALPGRGKTAFMTQVMYAGALHFIGKGKKVGFVSLEMTQRQILSRLSTIHSHLHPSRMRDAKSMSKGEWQHFQRATFSAGGIGDLPIEIFEGSGMRVRDVATVARRMHANGCRLILIDFIQTIRAETKDPKTSMDMISAVLRDTCKALQIPFVVASQLARRDANPNRRPTMQDLRESGNLEQDAANVLLLYRHAESRKDDDGNDTPPHWTLKDEILIVKQREGLTGWVNVSFREESLTFQPRNLRPAMVA